MSDLPELFKRITCGVYVVGVAAAGRKNAFTAAWIMPVSFDPLLLGLSIHPRHASYALLREGRAFSVNVLGADQMELARRFGTPGCIDKLAGLAWREGLRGVPVLEDVPAWFECEWTAEYPAGDHVLVLGRVAGGALREPAAELLGYRATGDMDGAAALYPRGFS